MSVVSRVPPDPDETVGATLARLRKAAGLTGGELGARLGMSQPKISRLERGVGPPDARDIERVARALGADEQLVRRLVERSEAAHNKMADWRFTPVSLASRQRRVGELEGEAQNFRIFEPAVMIGLLQTSGYARAVLHSFQRMIAEPGAAPSEGSLLEAVSERVRRQEILARADKHFHFLMAEAVLRNQLCPPIEMLAQIARVRQVADQANVTLKIIPDDAEWDTPPLHGFTMLDDRLIIVDLYNTGLTSRGPSDAARYRQVFDSMDEVASADIGPLLDRYHNRYVRLLSSPQTGHHAAN